MDTPSQDKDGVDVTATLEAFNIQPNACGKLEIEATPDNVAKHKELIDKVILFENEGVFFPNWSMRNHYSWDAAFSSTQYATMVISYNLLKGYTHTKSIVNLNVKLDPNLSVDGAYINSNLKEEYRRMFDDEDYVRIDYITMPVGIYNIACEISEINIEVRHNPILFTNPALLAPGALSEKTKKYVYVGMVHAANDGKK